MQETEAIGMGLYPLSEAARLLRTNRRTVEGWIKGYSHILRSGDQRAYAPVVRPQEDLLSFGELVELLYVRGFRDAKVPLSAIRDAGEKYREEWQTRYPFATRRFVTLDRNLLLPDDPHWRNALTGQGVLFVDELGKQLVHEGDLITGWYPLGKNRSVLLDPLRSFGQPIDPNSRVPVATLAQSAKVEGDPAFVAKLYGVDLQAVRDAVRFAERGYIALL